MSCLLTRAERFRGCLLGGAIGDAIGSYFEGRSSIADFCIPDRLFLTDDTQLTLATCQTLIEFGNLEPDNLANLFARWYRQRKVSGVGSSTLKALRELEAGGHWAVVGAVGERSAGNGAAMRAAPLAFFLNPSKTNQRRQIRDICRITHHNEEAYVGALAIIFTIRHVLSGKKLTSDFPKILAAMLPDSNVRDRLQEITDMTEQQYVSEFSSSGYVVDSVPLSILAACRSNDAMKTLEILVRFGGDADTNASLCGQILGAMEGESAFDLQVLQRINGVAEVQKISSGVCEIMASE